MKKVLRVRLAQPEKKELPIVTPFIRLDAALKLSGLAQTGGHAKVMIENGEVRVNGERCETRGKKLKDGDTFTCMNTEFTVRTAHEDQ